MLPSTCRVPGTLRWFTKIGSPLKDIKKIQHDIIHQNNAIDDDESGDYYTSNNTTATTDGHPSRKIQESMWYYRTRKKTEKPNIQVILGNKYVKDSIVPNERLRMVFENQGVGIRREDETTTESLMNNVLPRLAVETSSLILNDSTITMFNGPLQSSEYIAEVIAQQLDTSMPIHLPSEALNGLEMKPMQRIVTESARQLGYQLNDDIWGNYTNEKAIIQLLDKTHSIDNSIILTSGSDAKFKRELEGAFCRHKIKPMSRNLIEPVTRSDWRGGIESLNDYIGHLLSDIHPQSDTIHHGIFYPVPSEGDIIINKSRKDGVKLLQSLIFFEWIFGSASAFTTGGPGVGLTSWLYQNILSKPGVMNVKAIVDMSLTYPGIMGITLSHDKRASDIYFERLRQSLRNCFDNIEDIITPSAVSKVLKQIRMKSATTMGIDEMERIRRLFVSNEEYSLNDALKGISELTAEEIVSILKRNIFRHEPLELTWQ